MMDVTVAFVACVLVAVAIAYAEIRNYNSVGSVLLDVMGGVVLSVCAASPLLWVWFGIGVSAVEQVFVAAAMAAGLWAIQGMVR